RPAAGGGVGEDVAWKIAIPAARRDRLAGFRVALLKALDWVPVGAEMEAALESVVSSLGRLGCQVKVTQPDGLGDHRQHYALYLSLLSAVTSARVPAAGRRRGRDGVRR